MPVLTQSCTCCSQRRADFPFAVSTCAAALSEPTLPTAPSLDVKAPSLDVKAPSLKAPSLGIEGGWLYKLKKGSRMYTISREADGTLVFKEGTFAGTHRD